MSIDALVDLLSRRPLLTRKDLAARYGVSVRTIDYWKRNGTLPKPTYLRGCPFPFWRPADIEANEKKNSK